MRRPIPTALAVLLFGTIVLPGCFYVGPWGRHPHRDERWDRHDRDDRDDRHDRHERHGALTPQRDDRSRRDVHARRGD